MTYPFQEGLWELLITALYRAGRQADALATYQRVRALLADELGLDPGPAAAGARAADPGPRLVLGSATRRAEPPRTTPAGNLPSMSVELVGRERTSRRWRTCSPATGWWRSSGRAASARRRSPSPSVAGCATGARRRLAGQARDRDDADDVVDTLIAALNVTGGEEALFERLKACAALVILDNCEHVLDEAAALAVRLLDAAQDCGCCARARSRSTSTAKPCSSSLPSPSPTRSSCSPAGPMRSASRPVDDHDAVHDLCRSLDGLPLAIELAAARTKTLSIEEITRRLDDRFSVLSDPTSRRPERRRASGRRSGGATSCCSPMTSEACGRWPPSPAARHCPPSSPSSKRSTCPPRRRSTSSAGWPAGRW